jgi:hypothetical protein
VPFTGSHRVAATWGAPSGGYHPYPAVDIVMDIGTPVYAAGPGSVWFVRNDPRVCDPSMHATVPGDIQSGIAWCTNNGFANAGVFVELKHPDGTYSLYGHMSALAAVTVLGATVAAGQQIGWSGNTGITTGPHLHYEERNSAGVAVEPGKWVACQSGSPTEYLDVQHLVGQTVRNDGYTCSGAPVAPLPANPSPANVPASSYVPITPARLLETRSGLSTIDGRFNDIGIRLAGSVSRLQVIGRASVPGGATSAVLNVTATDSQADGYVTVFPCDTTPPTASNLNNIVGHTVANTVIAKIGDSGEVCVFTLTATHVIVDVNGYFASNATYQPVAPARLLETRSGLSTLDGQFNDIGIRPAGSVTHVQVTGRAGVPDDASSVAINVTATGPEGGGYVTVFPCGAASPTASNLNYTSNLTVANSVIAKIGDNGQVCIFTLAATHLLADVNGYFASGAGYQSITPARLLETRSGLSTADSQFNDLGIRLAGSVTHLRVVGRAGVPDGATSVVLNVTATSSPANGFVTVYPCGAQLPTASNVNFVIDQTVANNVVAKIGDNGEVCIFTLAATHLVADLNGYFTG